MSAPAAGGANPVLGAPIGGGGNPIAPGNPDTDHSHDGVTGAQAEAVSGLHQQDSPTSSSDKRTLQGGATGTGGEYGEEKDQALPLPRRLGEHDSARSSQDHVAELGEGGRGVSVRRGKEEFAALERRFSNLSQRSQERDLQRQTTRRSTRSMSISGFQKPGRTITNQSSQSRVIQQSDAEKGIKTEDDEFNLADVLRSGREKSDEAGIKHKKVGVVWEDLEVVGGGGLKINIRSFVSAIIEQVSPILILDPAACCVLLTYHSSSCPCSPSLVCLATSLSPPSQRRSSTRHLVSSSQEKCVLFSVDQVPVVQPSSNPSPTSVTATWRSRVMSRTPVLAGRK